MNGPAQERINVSYLAARIKPRNIKLSPDYYDFQDPVGQSSGAIWERAEDGLDAVPRIEIVPIGAGIGESDPEAGAVGGPHSTLRLLLSAWKWGFTASLGTEKPSMHAELASLLHLWTESCESFAVAKLARICSFTPIAVSIRLFVCHKSRNQCHKTKERAVSKTNSRLRCKTAGAPHSLEWSGPCDLDSAPWTPPNRGSLGALVDIGASF